MIENTSDMTHHGLQLHDAPDNLATKPMGLAHPEVSIAAMNEPPGEEEELQLLRKVTIGKGKPRDYFELSALLETNGLRDVDARNDWKQPDIFSLAKRLFVHADKLTYEEQVFKTDTKKLVVRVISNYAKGAVFALPMLLQIVSMVIVGFGIWSYINFSLRQATAISLGTLMALCITGGISQVIGRKGLYYLKMDEMILASIVTKRLFLVGTVLIFVAAVISVLLNVYFKLFPPDMFQLYIAYFILLSLVFLSFAVFYMFESFGTIALLVLFGIICTYFGFEVFKVGIVYSQYISLAIIFIMSILIILFKLRKIATKSMSEGHLLPSVSSLFFSLYPYFIFGTAYFLFIVMDRVLAWTGGKKFLPYFFWFNYPYEVGVDWALIPLIFTLALVEVYIYELGFLAFNKIRLIPSIDVKNFNNYFLRVYGIAGITFALFGVVSILLAFLFPYFILMTGYGKYVEVFFAPIHMFVFFCGSIAYVLLSWSLLNCITFFSYSRPEFALKSLGLGLLVDFLIGYVFSRSLDYYYSVVGLLIGSIVFAVFSTMYALRFFRRYDFYYYSSY
ncbi:MAG: hypothetical protein WCP20_05305 [Desulfuromonadales bacterium]